AYAGQITAHDRSKRPASTLALWLDHTAPCRPAHAGNRLTMPASTRHSTPPASPLHHASPDAPPRPPPAPSPPPAMPRHPTPPPSKYRPGGGRRLARLIPIWYHSISCLSLLARTIANPPWSHRLFEHTGLRRLGGRHQPTHRPRPRGPLHIRCNRYVIRPDDP